VLFSPAKVQGDGAGSEIARAIFLINQYHARAVREGRDADRVDVLIVGRGGGSTEDLWAFNQEEVARAIRKSAIPVISAVGHETDFTIADFVADVRAATPSAAAEIVAAREDQICTALDHLGRQLVRLTRFKIVDARARVQEQVLSHAFDEVKTRLHDARVDTNRATHDLQLLVTQAVRHAHTRANDLQRKLSPARLQTQAATVRARVETATAAGNAAIEWNLQQARERLGLAAASLDALSPLAVLQRGYAIVQDSSGALLRDSSSVTVGDEVSVRLTRGRLTARVESVATTDEGTSR
jgi:exodeoxyribonuclease VII large subunit